uniref:glucuronosyltransferase n=1 Tax=Meloidogyne incognita TaxID=6306 RepID=A0A914NA68_MELIC
MSAALLKAPVTIQYSNWPICDVYSSAFNLELLPSAYPVTGTYFSPKDLQNFWIRLRNTLWLLVIFIGRGIQGYFANKFYSSIGYKNLKLQNVERRYLLYAGRSEFITEPIKPINNRIKHFGCSNCGDADDYKNIFENYFIKNKSTFNCQSFNSTTNLNLNNYLKQSDNCKNKKINKNNFTNIKFQINSTQIEKYKKIKLEFSNIDWELIEKRSFVLVSFGSIAKVEYMPKILLNIFLNTFSTSSHLIIWQTNSPIKEIINENITNTNLPLNIQIVKWAPIKLLLAHPNLKYAILHGGVNTLNEALMFGKPILGIPLQGDQPSNLQRLVDLGMAELVTIRNVWGGQLNNKMSKLESEYPKYLKRAIKISEMIKDYRKSHSDQQNFWLKWALRKRDMLRDKKLGEKYFNFNRQNNYISILNWEFIIFVFICLIIC